MTSRERVLTALDHREPDRVPYDFGGTFVTSSHHVAYRRLREYLGLSPEVNIADIRLGLAWTDRDVQDLLGADVGIVATGPPDPASVAARDPRARKPTASSPMSTAWAGVSRERAASTSTCFRVPWQTWRHRRRWLRIRGLTRPIHIASPTSGPTANASSSRKGEPQPARASSRARSRSHCGCVASSGSSWTSSQDQALAGAILDKALEIKLRYWESVFEEIGDILDVIYDADDYGSQMAPLIAPDLWRKMIKPRISELYGFVHANSRAKVFLHSDGAIKSLIPDLIEAGVDGLNPVQFTADGMDLPELKQEFGREIAFWGGGVDTQNVLPRGTPDEVREQVLRNVETLMPGGGYIFATVHNIQADVPPENIVAMVEALREARRLPLGTGSLPAVRRRRRLGRRWHPAPRSSRR